jgi:predicted PurR-regulated permease PerM
MTSQTRPEPAARVSFPPTVTAVIFGAVLIGLAVLLVLSAEALAPYIVGLVLVFVMNGAVDRMARAGVPRWAGTVLTIIGLLVAIAFFVYVVLDALIGEFANLVESLPDIAGAVGQWIADLDLPPVVLVPVAQWVTGFLGSIPDLIPGIFGVFVGGVGSVVAFLFAVAGLPFWIFYAVNDRPAVMDGLRQSIPARYREPFVDMLAIVADVFGAWARSTITLAISVAAPFFLGFLLFGRLIDPDIGRYAVLFSVVLGLAEFVPVIGPVIAVIPILLITLAVSGIGGVVAVLLLFVVIQQLDGAILVPRIQGKALSLHPVVILPALVVGSALGGLLGAILAMPVTASARAIVAYLLRRAEGDTQVDEASDALAAEPDKADAATAVPEPAPERI